MAVTEPLWTADRDQKRYKKTRDSKTQSHLPCKPEFSFPTVQLGI